MESNAIAVEDSSLLSCYSLWTGKYLPTFLKILALIFRVNFPGKVELGMLETEIGGDNFLPKLR
jgi:hypothetical protein